MTPTEQRRMLTAVDLYIKESLEVHALCDRLNIPRTVEGAQLSMSQRVAVLAGVAENLMRRIGQDPVVQH